VRNEPVLTAASVTIVITAAINVLVLLKVVEWDKDQLAGINVLVGSTVALAFAVWARGRVKPV